MSNIIVILSSCFNVLIAHKFWFGCKKKVLSQAHKPCAWPRSSILGHVLQAESMKGRGAPESGRFMQNTRYLASKNFSKE
jgi:hypothetical protein